MSLTVDPPHQVYWQPVPDWDLQSGALTGENGASGSSEPVSHTASWLGRGFIHREVKTLQGCV